MDDKMNKTIAETFVGLLTTWVTSLVLLAGFALLASVPVWLLWNWLCPTLFRLPRVTLLQALGLAILSGLLFRNSKRSAKS